MFEDIINEKEEDLDLEFPDFMNAVLEYHRNQWDDLTCTLCGGTGFVPVMCCDGRSCGCHGMPVDFFDICGGCGEKGDYTKL